MLLPATHSRGEYGTPMMPPDSEVMYEMRHQFIGGDWSVTVSTRLAICTPVNVTSGTEAVPPTRPVCETPASHSPARVESPGSGYVWFSVHCSTSRYAVPPHAWVLTDASRFWVQNVGEVCVHDVVDEQFWSSGRSGQLSAWEKSHVVFGMHRSAVVNATRIGADPDVYSVSVPDRLSVP